MAAGRPSAVTDSQSLTHWHLGRLLAGLAFLGGALGSLNLIVGDVLRGGVARPVYGVMMLLCIVLGAVLWHWPALVDRVPLPLVLVGDAVYLVVVLTFEDASTFATPLMLLFTTILAAWVLAPRTLPVQALAVYLLCWVALGPTITDAGPLAVQVVVQGSVLNATAVVILVLRRRSAQLVRQMHATSVTDALTGLPNRRHLEEHVTALWSRAAREHLLVAALVIDLDHFKGVNDDHGHATGDELLRRVATALRTMIRGDDLLARTGGEEFVVLTLVADTEPVAALAERLRRAVRSVECAARTTASIGVAARPAHAAADPVDATWRLVDRADAALYEAKRRGRDRVVLLGPVEPVPHHVAEPARSTIAEPLDSTATRRSPLAES